MFIGEVRQYSTDKLAVSFTYDDGGNRVQKRSYDPNGTLLFTEYYFRDGQGNTMGIYRQAPGDSLVPTEHTLYTTGRLGTIYRQSDSYQYELKDHLGSVRATIERDPVADTSSPSGLNFVMSYWRDYYPFGWNIPGRESDGSYRYAFQGQELDEETGWLAFQLRMYDARVGRWMSTDPKREFASPYLAMGNRPMTLVDPDGGKTSKPDDWYKTDDGYVAYREDITSQADLDAAGINGTYLGDELTISYEGQLVNLHADGSFEYLQVNLGEGSVGKASSVLPLAAVDGPLPIADAVVGGTIAIAYAYDETQKTHVTYTRLNPMNGRIYSGRASGFGTAQQVMMARNAYHKTIVLGYSLPKLDRWGQGEFSRLAIRGREQQLIDHYGGSLSDGNLNTDNLIRAVAKWNPFGPLYHRSSNALFGRLHRYTGYY